MQPSTSNLKRLTIVAVFTALVFVATMIFQIPIPATGGYFNIGEAVLYAAALIFGTFVGAFSGGVGAALSDAVTGYPIFAPGTFIIKFTEGAIVGYVGRRVRLKNASPTFWRILSLFLGTILGLATYYIGSNYMGITGNPLVDQMVWAGIAIFSTGALLSHVARDSIRWRRDGFVLLMLGLLYFPINTFSTFLIQGGGEESFLLISYVLLGLAAIFALTVTIYPRVRPRGAATQKE
jgi:uncharacterized membrane protein